MACIMGITAALLLFKVPFVYSIFLCVVVYFSAVCYISQHIMSRTLAKKPNKFPQAFMLVEFGKIFLHIVVLAGFVYAHKNDPSSAKAFLVFFAAMFLIYLVFGTLELHRLASANRQHPGEK